MSQFGNLLAELESSRAKMLRVDAILAGKIVAGDVVVIPLRGAKGWAEYAKCFIQLHILSQMGLGKACAC